MAILASDNFDRANANPIGSPWTTITGESAMQIVGNVCTPSSLAADCGADYTGVTWPADHYSKAKLSVTGTSGGGSGACLSVRSASGARTLYRLEVDHAATNNVAVEKYVTGTPSALIGPLTLAWTDGDTWELRAQGTTISVYRNGVLVGSATDSSSPLLTGNPGIGYSSSETAASINDWEGGTPDGAGAPYSTRRAPGKAGPYDPKGFLLSNFKRFDYTPAVASSSFTLTPDVGSLVLDGLAPTFPVTVAPGTGSLTLTGLAPTFPTTLLPGFGQLVLTGFSPTLGIPRTIVTGLGSLVLTGAAPSFPTTLLPGVGSLILTGLAPSIGTPVTVVPGLGALILTGQAPTFPRTVAPGFGQLILNGFAPTLGLPQTLRPGLGLLVLDGFSPSFASGTTLQPGLGLLTLTGFAPVIGLPQTIVPGLGALTLTGLAPQIGVPVTVRPGLGALSLTGFGPAFTFVPGTLLRAIAHSDGTVSLVPSFLGTFGLVAVNIGVAPIGSGDSKTSSLNSANSGVSPIDPDN